MVDMSFARSDEDSLITKADRASSPIWLRRPIPFEVRMPDSPHLYTYTCCFLSRQAARSPLPSLERLKPFEGGGDDDDDGLDKDLWVVVEKGSTCSFSDCVYRDSVSQLCSRVRFLVSGSVHLEGRFRR